MWSEWTYLWIKVISCALHSSLNVLKKQHVHFLSQLLPLQFSSGFRISLNTRSIILPARSAPCPIPECSSPFLLRGPSWCGCTEHPHRNLRSQSSAYDTDKSHPPPEQSEEALRPKPELVHGDC